MTKNPSLPHLLIYRYEKYHNAVPDLVCRHIVFDGTNSSH